MAGRTTAHFMEWTTLTLWVMKTARMKNISRSFVLNVAMRSLKTSRGPLERMNMTSYKTKLKPYAHQKKASAKMRGHEAFALLMAMRTGKTKVALDDFGEMELEKEVSDQLIIAPAGVYHTWLTAMKEHCSDDLQERMLIHLFSSGAGAGERKRLAYFLAMKDKRRPRTLLINVEAFSREGDARKLAEEFLKQRPNKSLTAIDESTIIKNKSERQKFINKIVRPLSAYRRLLSGLYTPRSPLDAFYQFEFLDWRILGFQSYYTFRARVAVLVNQNFGGRTVPVVVGYHKDANNFIREATEPHSFRVEFRPNIPSTYSIHEVEMTKEQVKAYSEMKEFCTTKIAKGRHVTATVVIAQLTKLHQILCGHVTDEEGNNYVYPENRTRELLGILEEYNGKAIIWCTYDEDIQKVAAAIKKEYGDNSVARFWGGNRTTREEEERRFKTDSACRFQVATASAGGRGRTWDVADLAIYFSSQNNLEHRDQSEQRTMGVNKNRGVDIIDMICPGTVEMKFLEALRNKIDMASAINGDNYREWII